MRLHVLSDLHLESGPYQLPEDLECDLIVAAGDIAEGTTGIEFLKTLGKPVVYVLGNHEHYSPKGAVDMAERLSAIRTAAADSSVHLLERDEVVIGGVRFLGTTLWTDFGNAHPGLLREALETQNDYRKIGAQSWYESPENRQSFMDQCSRVWENEYCAVAMAPGRFHPLIALALHRRSLAWLEERLADPFEGATVVVTHHHPLYQSLVLSGTDPEVVSNETLWTRRSLSDDLPRYRVASYASNLTDLILRKRDAVTVWIAGHLHSHLDYAHCGVRIACNPRGLAASQPASGDRSAGQAYPGSGRGFDPWFTVDLNHPIRPVVQKEIDDVLPKLVRLHRESNEMAAHLPHEVAIVDKALREAFSSRTEKFELLYDSLIHSVVKSMGFRPLFSNQRGSWMRSLGLPLPDGPLRFEATPGFRLPQSLGIAAHAAGCVQRQTDYLAQLNGLPDKIEQRHWEEASVRRKRAADDAMDVDEPPEGCDL